MGAAGTRHLTTRRRFLRHGAGLAGAAALPAGGAGAVAATPNAAVRLAQADTRAAASSSAITVKSARVAGSAINYAYAVKAGPWVFLNGHEAFDFEHGLAAEVEGPPGNRLSGKPPLRREADYLLRRMRVILKEFGTDLPNAVRVDQFYTTGAAVSAYHLARFAEFGSYIPPSTSIIMQRCFTARTNTHTSMIAVVPGEGYAVDKFMLPGQAISASGYNPAVAANDFVFVAGNMAFRPDGTLDPRVYVVPSRNWGGETAFRRQVRYVITDRLEPSLKAADSGLEHSLKAQAYIRGVENLPDFMEVWSQHFRDIPCAVTPVPAKDYGNTESMIEINLIALKNGAGRRKQVIATGIPAAATYGPPRATARQRRRHRRLPNDARKTLPKPIRAFAISAGNAKHLTNAPAGGVVRPVKLEFASNARAEFHAKTRLLLGIIELRIRVNRRWARSWRSWGARSWRDRAANPAGASGSIFLLSQGRHTGHCK